MKMENHKHNIHLFVTEIMIINTIITVCQNSIRFRNLQFPAGRNSLPDLFHCKFILQFYLISLPPPHLLPS